jgi:hypothetical protein
MNLASEFSSRNMWGGTIVARGVTHETCGKLEIHPHGGPAPIASPWRWPQAVAIGALAIGAVAIGSLAIRKLFVGKARFKSLEIGELRVRRLRVAELEVSESLELPPKAVDLE